MIGTPLRNPFPVKINRGNSNGQPQIASEVE
jgi:hypothetical protein